MIIKGPIIVDLLQPNSLIAFYCTHWLTCSWLCRVSVHSVSAIPWVGIEGHQYMHMYVLPHYPHVFLKAKGILLSPLSVRPLCYLLLNHWTKFNQIWCVSYSHEWGAQRKFFFLALPPGALGRGQKVKYHLISITKSISKIFFPNFVSVLRNERYNTYQTFFLFCRLGHALGVGLGGT